jgi:hypothetical protein
VNDGQCWLTGMCSWMGRSTPAYMEKALPAYRIWEQRSVGTQGPNGYAVCAPPVLGIPSRDQGGMWRAGLEKGQRSRITLAARTYGRGRRARKVHLRTTSLKQMLDFCGVVASRLGMQGLWQTHHRPTVFAETLACMQHLQNSTDKQSRGHSHLSTKHRSSRVKDLHCRVHYIWLVLDAAFWPKGTARGSQADRSKKSKWR